VSGSFDQLQKAKLGDVAVAVNDGAEDMFKQSRIAGESSPKRQIENSIC
jgi:hypothetical protein